MLRVDTRLDLPRGTLLRYEHKSTVKQLVKGLVVSSLLPVRPIAYPFEPKNPSLISLSRPAPSGGNGRSSAFPSEETNHAA